MNLDYRRHGTASLLAALNMAPGEVIGRSFCRHRSRRRFRPAYLADLFGTHHVGGIHGRLLTAWSVAGVLGTLAITTLREHSLRRAIHDVAATVDGVEFAATFGAEVEHLDLLIEKKTVTLAKLLEIAPPGTLDPTPSLYNSTMYLMAFLLLLALVSNPSTRATTCRATRPCKPETDKSHSGSKRSA